MTTVLQTLKSLNGYPIPTATYEAIAVHRGLALDSEATQDTMASNSYQLAVADILTWLSFAPDVSQGGISYFSSDERTMLRSKAGAIMSSLGVESKLSTTYGYKGASL